jgi:uncharacterized glyoxalase superfamily protein PhnB
MIPKDIPQVTPGLYYDDPRAALEWLEKAFGFKTRLAVTDGEDKVIHAETTCGTGVIQVSPTGDLRRSPRALAGANTQGVCIYVDDVDALYRRARAAGARIWIDISDRDYGDRGFGVYDCEDHAWWFAQRVDQARWDGAVADYGVASGK